MLVRWGSETLHATDEGAGDPVLLLHGLGGSANNWLHQRRHLSARHRVVAVDLPGHGRSTGTDVSFDAYPDAIAATLDRAGIGAVSVVGLSMGARAGLWFADRYGDRVRSLVMVNTFLTLTAEDRQRRLDLYDLLLETDGAQLWSQALLEQMGLADHPTIARGFRAALARSDPRHLHDIFHQVVGTDQVPQLARLKVPVLLIRGEQDDFVPAYCLEELQAAAHYATVARLPGCGHLPYLEDPDGFNQAVDRFFDGHCV